VWDIKEEEWKDSLQMMLNCFAAEKTWGKPCGGYYIHGLKKGTPSKPSPLTHPWYRPANPPLGTEYIAMTYDEAKKHGISAKIRLRDVRDIGSHIALLKNDVRSTFVKVIGPYPVSDYKVNQFLNGLPGNEQRWKDRLGGVNWENWSDPAFQVMLDRLFPRTFECQTYNRQCDFYPICFKHEGWEKVLTNFTHRVPHHTTEPAGQLVWPKGDEPK
jgi:hypothetical protein